MTVKPQPGDFVVVPTRPPVGALITVASWLANLGEHGDALPQSYDHAEVYLGDGLTASAYPSRNGLRPVSNLNQSGFLWSTGYVPLSSAQREVIVEWCYQHAHVQYSALDYLALAAHTFHLNTAALQNYLQSSSTYICSQYVDAAYQAARVQLFTDGRWVGFVKPLDLAIMLQALGARPC